MLIADEQARNNKHASSTVYFFPQASIMVKGMQWGGFLFSLLTGLL
jgi:hypothetical protein